MSEFNLNRFRYNWKGDWVTGTAYNRDDIVKVGGKTYVCLVTHTANASFNVDLTATLPGSNPSVPQPKWVVMTESTTYKGAWQSAAEYFPADIVLKDGVLWKCTTYIGSSSNWAIDESSWEIYAGHIDFKGDWTNTTDYGQGALVRYNGIVYKCVTSHVSQTTLEDDLSKWAIFYEGRHFAGTWAISTNYRKNDFVLYGGSIWKCTQTHTSGIVSIDTTKFTIAFHGFENEGYWTNEKQYQTGDIVRYGGYTYIAVNVNKDSNPDAASGTSLDSTLDWQVLSYGYNFKGDYKSDRPYRAGDVVLRGGDLYLALIPIDREAQDDSSIDYLDTAIWEKLIPGQQWSKQDGHVFFDVEVRRNAANTADVYFIDGSERPQLSLQKGVTYTFDQSTDSNENYGGAASHPLSFSSDDPDGDSGSGSAYTYMVHYYLNNNKVVKSDYISGFATAWRRKIEIMVNKNTSTTLFYYCTSHIGMGNSCDVSSDIQAESGSWIQANKYHVGDVVYFYGDAYSCNFEHTSNTDNFPGDNGSGYFYWDILIQGGIDAGLNTKGDLLTYGTPTTSSLKGDGSSQGLASVPIGVSEQLLSVNNNDEVFWREYLDSAFNVHVTQNGVDEIGRGLTADKPFKTVGYALEFVQENFTANTPVKVKIATGRYTEAGPMVIPAGCVVMGDELRATTIEAQPAIKEMLNDLPITQGYLDRLTSIVFDLINNNLISASNGHTEAQVRNLPAAGVGISTIIANLITDIKNYQDQALGSGVDSPTVTGTNTLTVDQGRLNAVAILRANVKYLKKELTSFVDANNSTYSYTASRMESDIEFFIKGFIYDLQYPGNYKTVLMARRYCNRHSGSTLDDMFWVRDVTGIRNCTLEGLSGGLNPPGVFDLYRKPTGGAFVALDPGWGPADDKTWIKTRSPYLQGVTNIGTGCVGKKIDGALHNGGNKSMVSNDFTQVLSDGVGAWVLNNARAELVSVFTYYCTVGYLAENGGIIRATNGNNSYGRYGAIADGIDATETPATATVNGRNQEAIVQSVFAGEFSDNIFGIEYSNAGENYTQATASILGAGTNAVLEFDDFRTGGLFESRIIDPVDSGSSGGANFTVTNGNAQQPDGIDDSYQIKLQSTDTGTADSYTGMKIIITGGDGTGQYGIVNSYNVGTRTLSVIKETTGLQGWDHIIPGTATATQSTNTQYRIEPRITCSAPGFTSSAGDIGAGIDTIHSAYGDTTQSFTGIAGQLGTGGVIDFDGLTPTAATFDIQKIAKKYTVTINTAGLGYAVGDTITIAGNLVGGVTPANDITITVQSTTDDSSNSIVTFGYAGVARSGRYVVLGAAGVRYSEDTSLWNTVTLPGTTDYVRVKAGNNRFVAIRENQGSCAYSLDGVTWSSAVMPANLKWIDITYGGGQFVAIAENSNTVALSSDGINWTSQAIPDDGVGDSAATQWQRIAYGKGKYVVVSGSERWTATSTDGVTWSRHQNALGTSYAFIDFVALSYGRNKWIALATNGTNTYSFDGIVWYNGGDLPFDEDGSSALQWEDLSYGDGVWIGVATSGGTATTRAASSQDGINWQVRSTLVQKTWKTIVFGDFNNTPIWLALGANDNLACSKIVTGATALLRADVASNGIFNFIKIWDPGSGYDSSNPPTVTIIDNTYTLEVFLENRIGNGVIGEPSFVNRGLGYKTSSTQVSITGDGYADSYTKGANVTLDGISTVPGPGAQLYFTGILDLATADPTDLKRYVVSKITDLGQDDSGTGTKKVRFQVSPQLKNGDNLLHATSVQIREKYSQCRISGHDFLDIGTGNFSETNYPTLYSGGAYFVSAPENEVIEQNGGRVFYTSTDQNGNFRTGELFAVEQATGIVTISADFFDLDGLSELSLGGVRLGGSGAVIKEFSTDPFFSQDSNNVVPTQRAITTFLANRLSVGGSDLETNFLTAGQIQLGGPNNIISTTIGTEIQIPVMAVFDGPESGINGILIGQMLTNRNPFDESMQ